MKTILTLSGGLDSTVLLYDLLTKGHEVRCLSVNYGQRHNKELISAYKVCKDKEVEHRVVDLRTIKELLSGSSQTDPTVDVPHGHYAAENMKLTVVPNRNMILLAIAGAWAISTKSDAITYAAHKGDHSIYPDCREEFVEPLEEALYNADWHHVSIHRPLLEMTKTDIVKLGITLGVPFADTWSCYEGKQMPCGRCGTCCERLMAFHEAGAEDPLKYLDPDYWKSVI